MKYIVLMFLLVIGTSKCFSQTDTKSDTAYEKFRVGLFAISVADMDASIAWYENHLDFLLISRNDFPEYKVSVAVVERNDLQIEIVHYTASKAPSDYIKEYAKNPAIMQGIAKISFMVDNIDSLAARLESDNVKFVSNLHHEDALNLKSFIILDNSGNWLQFSQKDN